MRERTGEKRGGNAVPGDGFTRDGTTLASFQDAYLEDLRVHNRTPMAVDGRSKELKQFLRWTEERSLYRPEQITRSILESFQRHLWNYRKKDGRPLGVSTQISYLGAVKNFFAWLCRQHHLEANPASELEMPKSEKRLPVEALTKTDVELIMSMPDITDPLGIRDRAILELLYSTGIRRTELMRLELSNLNRERKLLHIRQGKGRKDRVVPVGTRAMQWLEKYLDDVRPLLSLTNNVQALFITGYGSAFNAQVLGRTVIKYIEKSNIGRKGGPHLFRHTCATHMLEGGADIRYIQQLLGHEKLETTAIYTEVSIIQLQAVHSRCHPAEQHGIAPETVEKQ